MQKIIIIEDDPVIREELALLLFNEGYQTVAVTEFTNVAMQVLKGKPNLILLDLNLPERDGLSLCADIRKAIPTPIIFVTSRDSATDELRALSMGGDDYITKPYNIPVLLARIKAVLRRSSGAAEPDTLEVGGLSLHLTQATASAGGKTVELTRNELKILSYLAWHSDGGGIGISACYGNAVRCGRSSAGHSDADFCAGAGNRVYEMPHPIG